MVVAIIVYIHEWRDILNQDIHCNCVNLLKTAQHLCKRYDTKIKTSGISANQFFLLSTLKKIGPCTTTKLASNTRLDRTTVARNIRPLVEKKYIMNQADENRRNNALQITDKGIEMLKKANQIWKTIQDEYAQFMGEESLDNLRHLLSKTQQF